MKLSTLKFSLALAAFAGVAACGNLSSDTSAPSTLATVSGTITNPSAVGVGSGAFRVAVVWDAAGQKLPDGSYATDHRTAQDIAVSPVFPAKFTLDLTQLPTDLQTFQEIFGTPASVDLRGTAGFVVAYEDTNGDGALDLVTASSGAYVDRVLGQGSLALLYVEGTMPSDTSVLAGAKDTSGNLPSLGFNLFASYCASGKPVPAGKSCESLFDWVPVTTPASIALAADPKLATLMCAELPSSATSEKKHVNNPGVVPATYPAKTDPNLKCSADGRAFSFGPPCTTATPPGVCQASVTTCNLEQYSLNAGAAAPSGWPCTVQ